MENNEVSLSYFICIKGSFIKCHSSMVIQVLVNQRCSRQDPKIKKKASSQKVCLMLQPSNIPVGSDAHDTRG
jgi:hypothetical protein